MNEDKAVLKSVLCALAFMLLIGAIVIGSSLVSSHYEVKAFNSIHGTEYTTGEWFWAEQTIKDYHLGTVENKNYQVDVNLNDERLKGGNIK